MCTNFFILMCLAKGRKRDFVLLRLWVQWTADKLQILLLVFISICLSLNLVSYHVSLKYLVTQTEIISCKFSASWLKLQHLKES